ncbi:MULTISPECIES: aromatic ring-hydroxylating dioxygenase subunit alpha [unclassified Synechococcus]|uniref:aromatic ring-hydroxylating oxygenase subunit alpha n=1 Tax=unclassified Synechococcus TaxID=2626047 RepID=UPI0021A62412|nr:MULTISPECIES: SRPBCC family protein [unclassified Synechococcus]MCT0213531.1 Rieske 2Fe-2S domain-containing protein [Synechococcus sp. CS-1326]MCT0234687.1 Rieske 2Fe-2S domain-containing protein [Synechococcus sp. CS-1327]
MTTSLATPPPAAPFLAAELYGSPLVAQWESHVYARQFWHPLALLSELPEGAALSRALLGVELLLTHPPGVGPQAFLNQCPHRGVALLAPGSALNPCRKLICPYHGWTYAPDGRLLAAAREGDFCAPFERQHWDLSPIEIAVAGPFLWVRLQLPAAEAGAGAAAPALAEQLDLLREQGGWRVDAPESPPASDAAPLLWGRRRLSLACNWKIAHDNTLDDYHVAIAHPTTLHRTQGPVSAYRHRFGRWCNLLATPMPLASAGDAGPTGTFLTFSVPPWNHVLLWPDGTTALIGFHPEALDRCRLELTLAGPAQRAAGAEAQLEEMTAFLEEDRALVESAQLAYGSGGFSPGPAHQLERRILHHQALYREALARSGPVQAAAAADCSSSSGLMSR